MRYVQNFVTLTPTVAVDAKISEKVDVDEVVSRIETKLEDEFSGGRRGGVRMTNYGMSLIIEGREVSLPVLPAKLKVTSPGQERNNDRS